MTAQVEFRGICQRFGDFQALRDIQLTVGAGEYAVLLGPSGCGKTTLLMILAGFIEPTGGEIWIADRPYNGVPPARRPTTTMFQDYALFPHMTVEANIMFGPKMQGVPRSETADRARALLELVNLPDAARKKPHALSGGQRQRVALARALAVKPDVLLLDEPLGALDLKLRKQMQEELKYIQREVGTTFIHVTHDQEEAMAVADKIVVMNHGHIEDSGTPENVYLKPASLFSAGFMGDLNRLDATIESVSDHGVMVRTPLGELLLPRSTLTERIPDDVQEVVLCFRPEHFRLDSGEEIVSLGQANVTDAAFFGTHQRATLEAENGRHMMVAHFPQQDRIDVGATVEMRIRKSAAILLAKDD